MPTIYKPLEPQPEIYISNVGEYFYLSFADSDYEGVIEIKAPYKPGDEIEKWYVEWADTGERPLPGELKAIKQVVKSIRPVQREGVWVWEIECGE